MSESIVVKSLQDLSPPPGQSLGPGLRWSDVVLLLRFQHGPLREAGINGCQVEDVITVLIERLTEFQRGPLGNAQTAAAISALDTAREALVLRTLERIDRGVEGTMTP